MARRRNDTADDYYAVLGVARNATDDDIKRAYRREALQWHPDKNGHRKDEAEARFKLIAEAYEVLRDPQARSTYDRYGADALRNGGADTNGRHSGHTNTFDPFTSHASYPHSFHFQSPHDIFREFFGGRDPFDEFFSNPFGHHPAFRQHAANMHSGRHAVYGITESLISQSIVHRHLHHQSPPYHRLHYLHDTEMDHDSANMPTTVSNYDTIRYRHDTFGASPFGMMDPFGQSHGFGFSATGFNDPFFRSPFAPVGFGDPSFIGTQPTSSSSYSFTSSSTMMGGGSGRASTSRSQRTVIQNGVRKTITTSIDASGNTTEETVTQDANGTVSREIKVNGVRQDMYVEGSRQNPVNLIEDTENTYTSRRRS